MSPSAKYGLGIIAVLLVVGFTVVGVFVGRQVASLAVIDDLEVGECVRDHFEPVNNTAEGEFFEILFVSRADCSEAHAYEMYAAASMWGANDAFPGVDAAFWQGEDYCHEQYAQFLGEDYLSLPYEFFTFVPTVELWNDGHRDAQCLIGHVDGTTRVTGSLRDAGAFLAS